MSRVLEVTESDDQQKVLKSSPKVVVFYGSKRCPHCVDMEDVFENLSRKYRKVLFVHVETTQIKVDNITGVPVFDIYRNGEMIDAIMGARKEALQEAVARL